MTAQINGRALHYVFKIGDRAKNAFFFRTVLGMKVLRHEEFKEGCEAQCNGPYDNRWSKTMIGYGPESSHFVFELTYNYGVKSYELGNDFGGVTIKSKGVLDRARRAEYPISKEGQLQFLTSPDGYKFFVVDEPEPRDADPVQEIALHALDLDRTEKYWHNILGMNVLERNEASVLLAYDKSPVKLRFVKLAPPLDRAKAYGRIAFAVPSDVQPTIDAVVRADQQTVLTPLITLDTPGKATVRVIILADPDGHEICFVDEEGFTKLSQFEEDGDARLDKFLLRDPFQDRPTVT